MILDFLFTEWLSSKLADNSLNKLEKYEINRFARKINNLWLRNDPNTKRKVIIISEKLTPFKNDREHPTKMKTARLKLDILNKRFDIDY